MSEAECPYCGTEQEIDHDDGYGYEEGEKFEQECTDCEKSFSFTTSISFDYSTSKADCLNGADHNYKQTFTIPKRYTRMRCKDCGAERQPTEAEMEEILASTPEGE